MSFHSIIEWWFGCSVVSFSIPWCRAMHAKLDEQRHRAFGLSFLVAMQSGWMGILYDWRMRWRWRRMLFHVYLHHPPHMAANMPSDYSFHNCDCVTFWTPTFAACNNIRLFIATFRPSFRIAFVLIAIFITNSFLFQSISFIHIHYLHLFSTFHVLISTVMLFEDDLACIFWTTPLSCFYLCWLTLSSLFVPHHILLSRVFVMLDRVWNSSAVRSGGHNSRRWLQAVGGHGRLRYRW